ncbi:hypothetical protein [Agrobacterium tumefaciens]|uniref:hypothetical protein n=1 Tax=Agrobacterium tumefaciens TaxID=358 RepID=UPI0015730BDF|nr:hypothetical protein [Agrobacterium tumefaciens]NTD85676.1 hypothetical protein [Agrobacterium tumefaciens]NTD91025.1 hypothetical protein [Agrobacterium tumefaciens]NTE03849.1 hypothetical protein [Agrobacterium tumefaciens]NTE16099.1 hypothetical protein [Agrobacterium tumefaciens]NTE26675.1 hypothetical protein [Agrobacterium tumefaciens]
MSLGKVIEFNDGSYEVRAIVDNRYIIRMRNRRTGVETYKIWTTEERSKFDLNQSRMRDVKDRSRQIYEKSLANRTYVSLGTEYGITPGRVRQICAIQARKAKAKKG